METAMLLIISAALLAYTLLPLFRPAEPFLLDVGARQRRRNALQQEKRLLVQLEGILKILHAKWYQS